MAKSADVEIIKSRFFRYRYRYGYSISVGALTTGIGAEPRIRAAPYMACRTAGTGEFGSFRCHTGNEAEAARPRALVRTDTAGVVLAGIGRTRNPAHTPDRQDAAAVLDEVSGLAGVRPVRVEEQPTERCTSHEMADQRM